MADLSDVPECVALALFKIRFIKAVLRIFYKEPFLSTLPKLLALLIEHLGNESELGLFLQVSESLFLIGELLET